jgi:predicted Zn-dependent protease
VIHSTGKNDTAIRASLEQAARLLPGRFGAERVFLESRVDLTVEIGWDGSRDERVTESSGVALDGRDSFHRTGVGVGDLAAFLGEGPAWIEGNSAAADDPEVCEWVRGTAAVVDAPPASTRGIEANPLGRWNVRLVAFRQAVWVVTRDGVVERDQRVGRRIEHQVWLSGHPNTAVITDRVLDAHSPDGGDLDLGPSFERAQLKLRDSSSPSLGGTAAVFAPGVGGVVIHELIGHALEGDAALDRPSWLHQAPKPKHRPLIVVDDPRRGRGAWRVDDEGVLAGATLLVDDGRAVDLMLDRASAKMRGRASNGHGRRSSYLAPVRPRMGCTWIEAGGDSSTEVVSDTNSGVFIRRLSAGHTDSLTGRASFIVGDADRIERGVVTRPLEPFVLELNGMDAWASIDRVADDLVFDACVGSCVRDGQPLAVSVGAPTMRIGVATIVS